MSCCVSKPPQWTPFQRVPHAEAIAQALSDLPPHWSLTPLRDKRPYRDRWQTEPFIAHRAIADLILEGEQRVSKTSGKPYRGFISGYGLRLGEASGGLVAIDIDGASAEPLLAAISGGDLPDTVSWTSGKPGRRQLLYQVPQSVRAVLKDFRRKTQTHYDGQTTAPGELLEFRYNRHQSALPPSRHPETGAYRWLRSPQTTAVAMAPEWLCDLLVQFAQDEQRTNPADSLPKSCQSRPQQRQLSGFVGDSDLEVLLEQSVTRLSVQEIYNWSGHQFRRLGKTLRGYCPQHQSHSGTAFTVDPETLEWYCFGCETGGGPAQYRHFVKGGWGNPSGKDFIEIVEELASQAGLSMPPTASEQNSPQQHWRDRFPERAHRTWQRSKQFTPTHTINQPYFDWQLPPAGTIIAVKSGLGTGKTRWLEGIAQQLADEGWVALGHRNSLLLQSCQRWGFYHLHSDTAFDLINDPRSKIALCVDSLLHFQPTDLQGKNIILDEAMAIVLHLLVGGTLKRNREQILERFGEALRQAKRVFCLDGMLADWCVDYLHRLAGEERELIKVENQYRGEPLKVDFLAASFTADGTLKRGDRSSLLQQLWQSSRPVICTDSQLQAEAIDRLLQAAGQHGIRIDSKTVADEQTQEFLRTPDAYIQHVQPDYLIYTPAAEAGVDISIRDYFSDQFCFFFGVLQTNAQLQMLGRIRDPNVKRWIWCRALGFPDLENGRSPFPRQIARAVEEFVLQSGLDLIDGQQDVSRLESLMQQLIAARQDVHYQAFCVLKAISNYERTNLQNCLYQSLVDAGHQVQMIALEEVAGERDREKVAKEQVKTANARAIFHAQGESSSTKAQSSNSSQDRYRVAQAQLKKQLPGIEKSPRWTPEFIKRVKYDERQFIAQQELFWLVCHPQVAQRQQQESYFSWVNSEGKFLGDIRNRWLKVRALLALDIGIFLDLDREWRVDSPEVLALLEKGNSRQIRLALGIGSKPTDPIQFLRRVLRLVGVKLERRRVRRERRFVYIYRINRQVWHDRDRLAVLECLERRWPCTDVACRDVAYYVPTTA